MVSANLFAHVASKRVLAAAAIAVIAIGSAAIVYWSSPNDATIMATPAIASEPKVGAGGAAAERNGFSADQRQDIEAIVREYLVNHPEILREMSAALQEKETAEREKRNVEIVISNSAELFRSGHDYVYGNPDGNIGVIEFFDYNCGWCKRALSEVQKLADADRNVRVVMKEFPIFGEDSQFAAKAAMASRVQGKYWDFHVALMKQRRVTKASTLEAAKKVGLDLDQLRKDMEKPEIAETIAKTAQIASQLDIQGTPAFIVDTHVNVGYAPATDLERMIADARKRGCQTC